MIISGFTLHVERWKPAPEERRVTQLRLRVQRDTGQVEILGTYILYNDDLESEFERDWRRIGEFVKNELKKTQEREAQRARIESESSNGNKA